ARQVLHAAAANEHHRVLLQVVALAADVADDLVAVGEAHLGDLAKRRVGLLRGRRVDARADAALLRASAQRRHLALRLDLPAALAQQLIDRRHVFPMFESTPARWIGLRIPVDRAGKKLSILGGYHRFRQLGQATCSLPTSASSIANPKEALEPGSVSFFLRVEW